MKNKKTHERKKSIMNIVRRRFRIDGFTMLELLIVLVILGLLTSLVAPQMLGKVDSSKQKSAIAQMQMLTTALDTYRLDVGQYPQQLSELTSSQANGWDGPYLPSSVPADPWGNPYDYSINSSLPRGYSLQSFGADGKSGGSDAAEDVVLPE